MFWLLEKFPPNTTIKNKKIRYKGYGKHTMGYKKKNMEKKEQSVQLDPLNDRNILFVNTKKEQQFLVRLGFRVGAAARQARGPSQSSQFCRKGRLGVLKFSKLKKIFLRGYYLFRLLVIPYTWLGLNKKLLLSCCQRKEMLDYK